MMVAMSIDTEYLDFCRVKKIFDRGFGFLTSIYFEEDVFFHFSKIKDKEIKEKLHELKRGVVYLFYTSRSSDGKRKVEKIWLDLKDVDGRLIPPFTLKIIEGFNGGRTNIYELAHVVLSLREAGFMNRNEFQRLLNTSSVRKIPSVIIPMLNESEKGNIEELEKLVEKAAESMSDYHQLCELLLQKLY